MIHATCTHCQSSLTCCLVGTSKLAINAATNQAGNIYIAQIVEIIDFVCDLTAAAD
jgi:hypothetical protein